MSTKILDWTDQQFLENWTDQQSIFDFGPTGLRLIRKNISDDNILDGLTVTAVGSTTINGTSEITDWDRSTKAILTGTGAQSIKIDGGALQNISLFEIDLHKEALTDTFGVVSVEAASLDTSEMYVKIPFTQDESSATITISTQEIEGVNARYFIFNFEGTAASANRVVISDIRAFQAEYTRPIALIRHSERIVTSTLTAFAGTVTEAGSSTVQFQPLVGTNAQPWYWTGSTWKSAGSDTTRYDEFSNTIADINTNIGSLISTETQIGLQAVYLATLTNTPSIQDATFTT